MLRPLSLVALAVFFSFGCSSKSNPDTASDTGIGTPLDAGGDATSDAPLGPTTAVFDLGTDFSSPDHFYDFPYPSDLRLGPTGNPQGASFPNPLNKDELVSVKSIIDDHPAFPVIPVAYFSFTSTMQAQDETTVFSADPSSAILLVDVDPASPDRGALTPTIATLLADDDYTERPGYVYANVLAVAPRPGFILVPGRKYAFVVRTSLGDAAGNPLGTPADLASLLAGTAPSGANGAAALALYTPLAQTLSDKLSIPPTDVAVATVFTTGDVVQAVSALGDAMLDAYSVTIDDLTIDTEFGDTNDRACLLSATVTYPQFQQGTPPYDTGGLFAIGSDGLPIKQREEVAPVEISLPKMPMPAGGYPLTMYFHGSGGVSKALINRGKWTAQDTTKCDPFNVDTWQGVGGCYATGLGPAYIVAPFGIAMAGSALPLNPERLPGADEYAYANLNNLAALRDTFRQGTIEQRLFIAALRKLTIDPSVVSVCTGLSLPAGETSYHFASGLISAQGQSMGGMYTNIIGSTEPQIGAVVPTGGGGYWSYTFSKTPLYGDTDGLIGHLLGTADPLSFMHPAFQAVETAIEGADPIVFTPRLARRPLAGHPTRSIYAPAGQGDSYFPTVVYDAMAIAYGNKEAGDEVWSTMQDALNLVSLDGITSYPVEGDLLSEASVTYSGASVEYVGDPTYDPHAIYCMLDAVKYQYSCFHSTFFKNGTPTIEAPAALGTPCP